MKKLLSRKGIILIAIPLFAIFLQFFLRLVLEKDFNTIGITLGALGLGQILPFIYFDHFVANKIMGIKPQYEFEAEKLLISYQLSAQIAKDEIESIKNLFFIAVFFNLALFMITIYFGLMGNILLHIIFGSISCIVSWYLLIFK